MSFTICFLAVVARSLILEDEQRDFGGYEKPKMCSIFEEAAEVSAGGYLAE